MCFISTFGLHRDPEFYPNPTEFRPERFLDFPNGSDVNRGLYYLPFGDGPRICIGMLSIQLMIKLRKSDISMFQGNAWDF